MNLLKSLLLCTVLFYSINGNSQDLFDEGGMPLTPYESYLNNRYNRTSFADGKLILRKDMNTGKIGLFNLKTDTWEIPAKYQEHSQITDGPYLIFNFKNGEYDFYRDVYKQKDDSFKLLQTKIREQYEIKPELYYDNLIDAYQDTIDPTIYYIQTKSGKGVLSINILSFSSSLTCIDTLLPPIYEDVIGLTNNRYNKVDPSLFFKNQDQLNVFFGILNNEITCSFFHPSYRSIWFSYPIVNIKPYNLPIERHSFPGATGVGLYYTYDENGIVYLQLNYSIKDQIFGFSLQNQLTISSDSINYRIKSLSELDQVRGKGFHNNFKGIDIGVPGYTVVNHWGKDYFGEIYFDALLNMYGEDSLSEFGEYIYPAPDYYIGLYQSGVRDRKTKDWFIQPNYVEIVPKKDGFIKASMVEDANGLGYEGEGKIFREFMKLDGKVSWENSTSVNEASINYLKLSIPYLDKIDSIWLIETENPELLNQKLKMRWGGDLYFKTSDKTGILNTIGNNYYSPKELMFRHQGIDYWTFSIDNNQLEIEVKPEEQSYSQNNTSSYLRYQTDLSFENFEAKRFIPNDMESEAYYIVNSKDSFDIINVNYSQEINVMRHPIADLKEIKKLEIETNPFWNLSLERINKDELLINNYKSDEDISGLMYEALIDMYGNDSIDIDGNPVYYETIPETGFSRSGSYNLKTKKWIIEPKYHQIEFSNGKYKVTKAIRDENYNLIETQKVVMDGK